MKALRMFLLMTILTGVIYPLVITGIAQVAFPWQSHGSLVKNSTGQIIGSSLIAQAFQKPEYFWPRPSAVAYNPESSGGSNLSVTSQDLLKQVEERKRTGFQAEMLWASGSGLDPHISPEAAMSQVSRVAKARGLDEKVVTDFIAAIRENRQLSVFGEERVNVLKLNQALENMKR
jgi:K+-transporting ATPase ATPase C chain